MIPISEEGAKAIGEIAKTGGKAIDAARDLGGFFGKVLGPAATELGQTLHDWTRLYRYQNLLRIRDKVEAIHAARRLEGKTVAVPPKYAIPMLENASLEEDDTLQDMWAGLIANATDPQKRLNLKRVFSDVLSSLEPLDGQVLRHLSAQGWKMFRNVPGGGITVPALVASSGATESDIQISLQNLHRLGLIVDEYIAGMGPSSRSKQSPEIGTTSFGIRVIAPDTSFRPSSLGFALLKACER
jgi:hypothetical protein